jgi:hypothetical protein
MHQLKHFMPTMQLFFANLNIAQGLTSSGFQGIVQFHSCRSSKPSDASQVKVEPWLVPTVWLALLPFVEYYHALRMQQGSLPGQPGTRSLVSTSASSRIALGFPLFDGGG